MKDKILENKIQFIVFSGMFLFLIFFYIVFFFINHDIIKKYDQVILPSIYLDDYDMSNYHYDELDEVFKDKQNYIYV